MYLFDLTNNGIVKANGFDLFRLKRPFGHLFDRRKNKTMALSYLMLKPSKTVLGSRIRRYSVRLDKQTIARLHCRYSNGLKCHALYKTFATYSNADAYRLFVAKALNYMLTNLYTEKIPSDIAKYLQRLIQLVFDSFPFECIYTDCHRLEAICKQLEVPVIYIQWNLIKNPGNDMLLEGLLATHKRIPLNLLDQRYLPSINIEHTDIDPTIFKGKKNYIFLTLMNNYFAGFCLRESTKHFGGKEVLPMSIFSI
jgi:hypothetical protein